MQTTRRGPGADGAGRGCTLAGAGDMLRLTPGRVGHSDPSAPSLGRSRSPAPVCCLRCLAALRDLPSGGGGG